MPWSNPMDIEEALELASKAIEKVAHIATALGAKSKERILCGKLGGELLIVAGYLNNAGSDQQRKLQNIWKLLKDVEQICCWPASPGDGYPSLRGIVHASPCTPLYKQAEEKISSGLLEITSGKGEDARVAIQHLKRFTKAVAKPVIEEVSTGPKSTPIEYTKDAKTLAYNVLCSHMHCTCTLEISDTSAVKRHLVNLRLRSVPPEDQLGDIHFDMLFSSVHPKKKTKFGHWQDAQLLIAKVRQPPKKPEKKLKFQGYDDDIVPDRKVKRVTKEVNQKGGFCGLICEQSDSRLCLTIHDGKLQQFLDCEPLKQIVDHSPSISLTTILRDYDLTPKMKASLAYILAQSVWQFYDSDWMKTRWTSETIQFMWEHSSPQDKTAPSLFPAKPYFSVKFGEDDNDACEWSSTFNELHRYPRVRALGIILVEIGNDLPLPEPDEELTHLLQINKAWSWAWGKSNEKKAWPNFDYPKYRIAVKNSLDPDIFSAAPFDPEASECKMAEGLKKRRKVLYDKVVFPLEELLTGTGWKEDLQKYDEPLGPRTNSATEVAPEMPTLLEEEGIDTNTDHRRYKKTEKWITQFKKLSVRLNIASSVTRLSVAVLDTGVDYNHKQFRKNSRIKERKSWVDDKPDEDACGHGTHIAGAILSLTENLDIYIAKIATSETFTDKSSIAEAIKHARKVWKVDMISLSFGFEESSKSIEDEIKECIYSGILVFAAASNDGMDGIRTYPAKYDGVLCIHAATGEGNKTTFNPPHQEKEDNFMVVGDCIRSSWRGRDPGSAGGYKLKSGTSFATPVAVCIAAFMITYVREKMPDHAGWRISPKSSQGVKEIFRIMATNSDGYDWISPSGYFRKSETTIQGEIKDKLEK